MTEATLATVQHVAPPALFGSDPEEVLAKVVTLADGLATVVEAKGLAHRYGDNDRPFLVLGAWQVIASQLGVTCILDWSRELESGKGWEARATAYHQGQAIGAGEGMCERTERGKERQPSHHLRAMAQTRAIRRALQHVLGFIPALAGLDVANPDAPATRKQVTALHTLAGQLEWSHEESHGRAGVESFNDLTREQAAELIDAWSALVPPEAREDVEATEEEPASESSAPAPPSQWTRALALYGSKVAVVGAYMETFAKAGASSSDITAAELAELIARKAT